MGLLENLRKRATEASGESEPAEAPVPAADSEEIADDDWLVGVDRRSPEFEAPAPDGDVTAAHGFDSLSGSAAPAAPDSETRAVRSQEPSVPQALSPAQQNGSVDEDLGMVYAGLEQSDITPFPSEAPLHNESDSIQPFPSMEAGPIGPEAAVHLATLELSVGCTWEEVTMARRRLLESLTDGSAEAWNQRVEVNHAYASLRLLRVGPLKH